MIHFYRELPEGYALVREVDAIQNKKIAIGMNIAALVLMLAALAAGFWLRFGVMDGTIEGTLDLPHTWPFLLGYLGSMLLYMVLHELLHGVVYKALTGEKLTFGLSWSCAYCGVPHIYVTRRTALLALLAPFTVFTVLLLPLIFVWNGAPAILSLLLFATHFGGCAGDLYVTYLLLFRLKGDLLMQDTGPKQSFYLKKSEE